MSFGIPTNQQQICPEVDWRLCAIACDLAVELDIAYQLCAPSKVWRGSVRDGKGGIGGESVSSTVSGWVD